MSTGALETTLRAHGFTLVAGVDEAGRGALAGPLVAAAVVLPPGWIPEGLRDSKLLTPGRREELHGLILEHAVAVAVRRVRPATLDRIGLQAANLRALAGAVRALDRPPDYLLIDGRFRLRVGVPCLRVVKGDRVSAAVAAASVVAKVTRDRAMVRMEDHYPGYGFARHKGYGVPEHRRALSELGPCPAHRRVFEPVARVAGEADREAAMLDDGER